MNCDAIDQLVNLSDRAQDTQRIAFVDLFRLLALDDRQAEYIFTKHWSTLIEKSVISYVEKANLKDKNAKSLHNFHMTAVKLLTNVYHTEAGR